MQETTPQTNHELGGLGISAQAVQALLVAGITTKAQLREQKDSLSQIKGIGEATVKQIFASLDGEEKAKPEETKETGLGVGEDAPAGDRPRQGELEINCPYHGERCKANRSEAMFTRYYCPVKGCNYTQKVARPDIQKRLRRQRDQEEDFSARPDRV